MAKVDVYRFMVGLLLVQCLFLFPTKTRAQYQLKITAVDKDSVFINGLKLQTNFKNVVLCSQYVTQLPDVLQRKGYPAASIDSVTYDSLQAHISLYIGNSFSWAYLNTDSVDKLILDGINWNKKGPAKKPIDITQFQIVRQKILDFLENNGYPFAKIEMDSISLQNDSLYARIKIDKGPLYKIDSIRNYGNANISNNFLQRYLSISNASIYRKERLESISKKINELPYLQEIKPYDITLLGTGSILNLYLAPKKSSQVNVLVGFLPSTSQLTEKKLLITGEANINLKNALGNGETIGLNWQQIQVKSPRLDILFQQPYLFNTPFGINFGFNLFKKDSSFVNISLLFGVQYALASNKTGSVYIQNLRTSLLTIDTSFIKNNRRLPAEADVSSVNIGLNYEVFTTNYRFNPRKGSEFQIDLGAGTKKLKKNNIIVKLRDNSDPSYNFNSLYDTFKLKSYQFRIKLLAAHYFPLSKASTLKAAINGGWFQSPNIFRNELFQIGGYKLLRGFDEESIFASQYATATAEYRYLLGQNSFFFSFIDFGWIKNNALSNNIKNSFIGAGLGMAFETKAGIFNISYAAGKRDDVKFNLRQSKIHLGYANYF